MLDVQHVVKLCTFVSVRVYMYTLNVGNIYVYNTYGSVHVYITEKLN